MRQEITRSGVFLSARRGWYQPVSASTSQYQPQTPVQVTSNKAQPLSREVVAGSVRGRSVEDDDFLVLSDSTLVAESGSLNPPHWLRDGNPSDRTAGQNKGNRKEAVSRTIGAGALEVDLTRGDVVTVLPVTPTTPTLSYKSTRLPLKATSDPEDPPHELCNGISGDRNAIYG
jgi:hypothetical protein